MAEQEVVVTPGGRRSRSKTAHVSDGQGVVVNGNSGGAVQSIVHTSAWAKRKRAEGLVVTPGGFRHPSQVHRVERDHVIRVEDGKTQLVHRVTSKAIDLPETTVPESMPGLGTGWITFASFTKPAGTPPFSFFSTKWKVPPPPPSFDDQLIYIFNAMMDSTPTDILQPVLQWGESPAGGGYYWSITSWFIDKNGNAFYRDLTEVCPGTILQGVMRNTNQSNGTFDYESRFEGYDDTLLTVQGIVEQVILTETLECYSIDRCSDYPDAYYTAMFDIDIETVGPIQAGWVVNNQVTDCGQHTNVVSNASQTGEVDLFYKKTAPHWNLQQITGGIARTVGAAAVGAPFISVFGQQQHFAYRDAFGFIRDAWYDGDQNKWNLQEINVDGQTTGTAASSAPFVSVFNNQQHFTYPDGGGGIWDAWYDSDGVNWSIQKINTGAFNGGVTGGPAAVSEAFVSVFDNQQHFAYLDVGGKIWDSWYDGDSNTWNVQQINGSGNGRTAGPAAVSVPAISVYKNQQHFAYRDASGLVWDSWWNDDDGSWNLQQLNGGGSGRTNAPLSATDIVASVFVDQQHSVDQQHFAYCDGAGNIWDCWYDGHSSSWNSQQLNNGARTTGPSAAAVPAVSVFGQQQHFAYRDSAGVVWDAWYNDTGNSWNLQQLNGSGGRTDGPPAVAGPVASVFGDQQHFAYTDGSGAINDAWYDGVNNAWALQKLNNGGMTEGPAAVNDPFVSVYEGQSHIAYRSQELDLWDSWYDGDGHWNLQKINRSGVTAGPSAFAGPFISVFDDGNQQHFAYNDRSGNLADSWYDHDNNQWNLQQINNGGVTTGPLTHMTASVSVFNGQQHFAYVDKNGVIWDSWYDSGENNWNLQQINSNGRTAAPAAAGEVSIEVTGNQQHFVFRDFSGAIWDSWYDNDVPRWDQQQINLGGRTTAPAAAGDPFLTIFHDQQHIAYRDSAGIIWDCWYDPSHTSWQVQQMNANGLTPAPLATSDPFVCVLDHGHHFTFTDASGAIWNVWYFDVTSVWDWEQINLGSPFNKGVTTGPAAAGSPYVWVYNAQLHFTWRDANGMIWDAWYQA
jgi:hypothetical protein